MNKTLIVSLAFLSNLTAFASVTPTVAPNAIRCTGAIRSTTGEVKNVKVSVAKGGTALDVSIYAGAKPVFFETTSYAITQVLAMFPVYSVTASKDLRRADGTLTVAHLAIQNEVVGPKGTPGKLTLNITNPRGNKATKQYAGLNCTFRK